MRRIALLTAVALALLAARGTALRGRTVLDYCTAAFVTMGNAAGGVLRLVFNDIQWREIEGQGRLRIVRVDVRERKTRHVIDERSAVRREIAVVAPVHRQWLLRSARQGHLIERRDVRESAVPMRGSEQHLLPIPRPAHHIVSTGEERELLRRAAGGRNDEDVVVAEPVRAKCSDRRELRIRSCERIETSVVRESDR